MKWIKRHWITLALVAMLLIGLGLLLYPTVSNYWNSLHQSRVIMDYASTISTLNREQYEQVISSAEEYNQELAESGIIWNFTDEDAARYNAELNIDGSGVMGYITIPKIDVQLPVCHGTDDKVLSTSIGHLEGTSLPVGGEGSHCVLSGHRGVPSSRLFTDLDKLVEGDTFTLTILNETLTYEVDQIRVVLPTDMSDIQIEPGKDYCTLVTCTPYGINTHRLLVRGHRIANANGDARLIADAIQIRSVYIAPFVAVPILVILLILFLALTRSGENKETLAERYYRERGLERPHVRPEAPEGKKPEKEDPGG